MTATESPRHWVIPGVLRRQGRMMIVAGEGSGKTVLLRQIAVMAAAGLHPFKGGVLCDPINVLVVDLENDPATGMDEHATIDPASPLGLVVTADRSAPDRDRTKLRVWSRPDGIDLRNPRDIASFERILARFTPDFVTFGPLYKAYRKTKGEDDETFGASLQTVLDRLRISYDAAWIFEHHAPLERTRLRPFGSSLWLRWPDIGIGTHPRRNRRTDDNGTRPVPRRPLQSRRHPHQNPTGQDHLALDPRLKTSTPPGWLVGYPGGVRSSMSLTKEPHPNRLPLTRTPREV